MMWIAYHSRVDNVGAAVAELPALAQNLFEDLEQYTARAEPSWRPDVHIISSPRTSIELSYVDSHGVTCPIALFQVCPPEEGPDRPERTWWLRSIPYPTPLGDPLYRAMVVSAAGWLRERPHAIRS